MAWTSVGTLGAVAVKAANQTSLLLGTGATAEAGNVVVVVVVVDNAGTADGDNADITSITDSVGGNTWTKAKEFTNAQGAAGAGTCVSVWFSKLANEIPFNGGITANFASATAVDAAAMTAWEFTIGAGNVVTVKGSADLADDGVDPSAITVSGLTSQEYLWVHGLGAEGPDNDAYTWDADYSQFSADGTTGGAAASNQHVRGGFRIFTGTADTVDVTSTTADRDYAQVLAALLEAAPPVGPPIGTLALMGAGR